MSSTTKGHLPRVFHATEPSKHLHRSLGVVLSHLKTPQKLMNEFRERGLRSEEQRIDVRNPGFTLGLRRLKNMMYDNC